MLGCGEWTAYITARGGAPVLWEVPWVSLDAERTKNASGRFSATLGVDATSRDVCCEVLNEAEPWAHELVLWRSGSPQAAYAGPIVEIRDTTVVASDLYAWMSKRFVERDLVYSSDAAIVFEKLFRHLRDKEPSMNVDILSKQCGIDVLRKYLGEDKRRGSDLLSELGRSAVDFTTVGRTVYVGGIADFLPSVTPVLLDGGVEGATASKLGANLATDIAIMGDTLENDAHPIQGRAKGSTAHYGLLQESYSEPLIRDRGSANANARGRLLEQSPAPRVVDVTFAPDADVSYSDLMAGMRFDTRLTEVSGCISVVEVMEMPRVVTNVAPGTEAITASLVPLTVAGS